MIYETVSPDTPLQQGDIFSCIPKAELSLSMMAVLSKSGDAEETTWQDLVESGDDRSVTAVVGVTSVMAILVSQNCDNARGEDITLCAIEKLSDHIKDPSPNVKGYTKQILKHAEGPRYFYLPKHEVSGISEPMTVDFRSAIRLRREDLLGMRRNYRRCRLNGTAYEHLRESLANFYRRYPVNDWYPLTADQVSSIAQERGIGKDDLYEWQR
jgi:hypothetical protein